MAKRSIEESTLVSIADAIRGISGAAGGIDASDFAAQIKALDGGVFKFTERDLSTNTSNSISIYVYNEGWSGGSATDIIGVCVIDKQGNPVWLPMYQAMGYSAIVHAADGATTWFNRPDVNYNGFTQMEQGPLFQTTFTWELYDAEARVCDYAEKAYMLRSNTPVPPSWTK